LIQSLTTGWNKEKLSATADESDSETNDCRALMAFGGAWGIR
jgi:hypothetical protein